MGISMDAWLGCMGSGVDTGFRKGGEVRVTVKY